MTHINTINNQSNIYTYDQLQAGLNNGTIDTSSVTDVSVFNASSDSSACKDGKDDGKIGFWEGCKETLKGAAKWVGNTIKGMFFDEEGNFSLKNTLKTAVMVGACFIPGVGPVIATGLAAYGAVSGAVGIAKGVSAAANATTDAEKREAFQSIGGNALQTAVSVAGVRGGVKGIAKNAGLNVESGAGSALKAGKALFKEGGTGSASLKTFGQNMAKSTGFTKTGYYGSKWTDIKAADGFGSKVKVAGEAGKTVAQDTAGNIYNTAKATKETLKNKANKLSGKSGHVENLPEGAEVGEKIKSKNGKTAKIYKENPNGGYDFETKALDAEGNVVENTKFKTETKLTKSETTTVKEHLEKLPDGIEDASFKEGKYTRTLENGVKETYTKLEGENGGYKLEQTTPNTKATTSKNSFEDVKNTKVKIKNAEGGTETVTLEEAFKNNKTKFTDANGVEYALEDGTVTQVKIRNIGNLSYNINDFKNGVVTQEGYISGGATKTGAIGSKGYLGTAGIAGASAIGSTSSNYDQAIQNASTPLAQVNTQTGREYDLEDYTIKSQEEIDNISANINSSIIGII